tara:strand:- start:796 stop:1599 length:804 start_codon:yes stop_codon:yes gene_type:complete
MNCPNCNFSEYSEKFKSYSNIHYKKCENCRCVYQDPIIKLDYSDNYWQGATDPDGVKRDFTKEKNFKIKNWYGDTIKFVNAKQDITVLDVGCGLGYFLSALNKNIIKYGIEDSQFACEYIKKNFKDINILNGKFQDIYKFNIQFDVIMFYHVIEHLNNPAKSIEFLKRYLKKDGILIIGTPNVSSFVAKIFGKNFRHFIPAHICLYDIAGLKKLVIKNNFQVLKIEKPFFGTIYNNISNYFKMFSLNKISPAFYGSIFTLYCKKNDN